MNEKPKLDAFANKLLALRNDPVEFVRQVLGAEPDKWQIKALESIVTKDRISIRSGHGVGKTSLLSWYILIWQMTRYPAKSAITAPTAHQLQDVLWAEVSKWFRKMPRQFQKMFLLTQNRLEVATAPQDSFAVCRTSAKQTPEAFQGFHSENMLFIVDEASAVESVVFVVGSGSMSSKGAKTVMAGNPTRTSGYFYDSFHSDRARWTTFKVGCEEAKFVDPNFVKEMADKYGTDSNVYRVRVEGEFPLEDDDTVIPLSWIESAVARDVEPNPTRPVIWGLDVARFGSDKTALCKRRSNSVMEPLMVWQNKDLMQTCGLVMNEWKRLENFADERPEEILVDSIGLGSGVVDRLCEMGLPVRGINVGEAPSTDGKTYMRLRDELWFKARNWFQGRDVRIPEGCEELVAELSMPHYEYSSSGKIKVEDKASMKKRGLKSPDLADAFCLTLAHESAFNAGLNFKSELPEMEVAVV